MQGESEIVDGHRPSCGGDTGSHNCIRLGSGGIFRCPGGGWLILYGSVIAHRPQAAIAPLGDILLDEGLRFSYQKGKN